MPLTQPQVQSWLDEFLDAMSAPVDFNRMKPIMSKRVTVDMPGEAKMKKFEDWEKKQKDYLVAFKGAKRTIPKGSPVIVVAAKKDEVDVIVPHLVTFKWTKELGERYLNVNLTSGDSTKLMMYDRIKLSSKSECGQYSPLFNSVDFKQADRADDDDTWGHKLVKALNEKGDALGKFISDDIVYATGSAKMNKEQWLEHEGKHTECVYTLVNKLPPVLGMPDKDGVHEAIVPLERTFKWNDALKESYPGAEFVAGAPVRMVSYEQFKVKDGKALWMSPHCDPATCIKTAGGKSGAN